MVKEIKLPEIAENVNSATVVNILVEVGDKVDVEQPLIEMESDKASFELPSLNSGIVKEIKVKQQFPFVNMRFIENNEEFSFWNLQKFAQLTKIDLLILKNAAV